MFVNLTKADIDYALGFPQDGRNQPHSVDPGSAVGQGDAAGVVSFCDGERGLCEGEFATIKK